MVSTSTNYDERTLAFAKDYSNQLLAIDVNLDTTEMLDVALGTVRQILPSGRSKYQEGTGRSVLEKIVNKRDGYKVSI